MKSKTIKAQKVVSDTSTKKYKHSEKSLLNGKWTPKGKPKDGYYFEGLCPKHGKVQVVIMGDRKRPICWEDLQGTPCTEGVKITEEP